MMTNSNSSPCFFCLKDSRQYFGSEGDIDVTCDRTEPLSTINLFCLRNISRFLNLMEKSNDDEDNSSGCGGATFKDLKMKLSEFDNDSLVPVCENCSEYTKNFSELYEVLLEAKRQLECCVQKMHDVITKAKASNEFGVVVIDDNDDDDNNEDFATNMTIEENEITTLTTPGPMEQLQFTSRPSNNDRTAIESFEPSISPPRPNILKPNAAKKSTKKKLTASKKTNPPQKNQPDYISNFIPTTSNQNKVTCKLCKKIMKRRATLWHYTYSCRKGLLRCPPGKNFTALVNQGSPFSCNYCRKEFAGPKRANLLIHHWIRFHPEHFFLDEMKNLKEGVTKLQFQMILHNILFPQVQPKQKNFYKCCSLCKKKFDCSCEVKRKYLLRKHLLYQHKPHLIQRLKIILRDPKLRENLSSFDSKGKSCHCGIYIPSWGKSSQSHHKKYHCNLGKDAVELSSERQKVINEMDEFTLESEDDDNDIVEIPKKRKTVKVVGKSSTRTMTASARNRNRRCPDFFDNVTESTNACPFCRANILSKRDIRQHLIFYHCKHLFPNHKLDWISDSDFQKIVVELLFKDFAVPCAPETRCGYCKAVLQDRNYKIHFVMKHYEILEEKLEDIQNDPDLHEELQKCNPTGGICRCGIYLTSYASRQAHERLYCALTANLAKGNDKLEDLHGDRHRLHSDKDEDVEIITIDDDDDMETPRRKVTKGTVTSNFSCSYCRAQFFSKRSLRYHMLQYHLKHFFPSHKLDSVTDLQFQKILADILFQDFVDIKKTTKCLFCKKAFPNNPNLQNRRWHPFRVKSHMIQFHFQELEKRLAEIQEDPSLHEMLEKCSDHGMICEMCGQYLTNGDGHVYHAKYHCPGTGSTRK